MAGWKRLEKTGGVHARDFGHGPVDKWMRGLESFRPVHLRRGGLPLHGTDILNTLLRITDNNSNRCVDVTFILRQVDHA